ARPQGARTRPGPPAVARYAGSAVVAVSLPRARGLALGYALSPAARARPGVGGRDPRARGLALGYTLSPAARAHLAGSPVVAVANTKGSRTRPGLHAVARCAGCSSAKEVMLCKQTRAPQARCSNPTRSMCQPVL
ncbi:MAG TPA: hypothetical protein VLM38_13270, partial [Blastocatellia bacterium]|nr:hypothetical protein [Blastocatellia bacterium]